MPIEECRVFDAKGKLIRTISSKEGSKIYWEAYVKENSDFRITSKTIIQLTCKECNKPFKATAERKYCYTPCTDPKESRVRADIPMKPRICENYRCKKTFNPVRSRQIFCNNPCVSRPSVLKIPKTRKCKQCKKVFKVESKTQYCNNPCTRYTAFVLRHKRR